MFDGSLKDVSSIPRIYRSNIYLYQEGGGDYPFTLCTNHPLYMSPSYPVSASFSISLL